MKEMVESALLATANAKEQIAKIREKFQIQHKEFEMADDAVLAVGWSIKRLKTLRH